MGFVLDGLDNRNRGRERRGLEIHKRFSFKQTKQLFDGSWAKCGHIATAGQNHLSIKKSARVHFLTG